MTNIVKINNKEIEQKFYNNLPVITFKDIDRLHGRPEGTAKRDFRNNQINLFINQS